MPFQGVAYLLAQFFCCFSKTVLLFAFSWVAVVEWPCLLSTALLAAKGDDSTTWHGKSNKRWFPSMGDNSPLCSCCA